MITYNKIVRDKIPAIIKGLGKNIVMEKVEKEEHLELLNFKLKEELDEYLEEYDIEELADLMEVINGILFVKGISKEEFEEIRRKKYEEKGGFEKGYKLIKADK